jgi:beta-aspartyl-peptidase (threonine type)
MSYQIIVHGGAYDNHSDVALRKRVCGGIVAALEKDLSRGAAALDICEQAINMLEDDPLFDAGTGSYIQTDGEIRMDASLMTSDLDLGCVLQIGNVKNPISVARKILENPLHCTLSGEGANQFAREMGFARHDPRTPETRKIHEKIVRTLSGDFSYANIATHYRPRPPSMNTVGCVVRDRHGMIVAGTSTGGREVCYQGRVGDSGQPGNGTYADSHAGISCTGVGEMIMRVGMARIIALYVELGDKLDSACEKAMNKLAAIGGRGGVIAISHKGEIIHKHNTLAMDFAMAMGESNE